MRGLDETVYAKYPALFLKRCDKLLVLILNKLFKISLKSPNWEIETILPSLNLYSREKWVSSAPFKPNIF